MNRTFNVFYSWQSDCDPKQNRFFIRDALKIAIKRLNNDPKSEYRPVYRYDSDTKGRTGTIDIAATILDKIDQSDVFLCDITTINAGTRKYRKTPNPNVAIELGYASSQLGWESIICLFNTAIGEMPDDLPFDIYTRRVLSYHCTSAGLPKQLNKLSEALFEAILSIADNQSALVLPPNPRDFRKEKVVRDQANITRLLATIHAPSFDAFIEYASQGVIIQRILFFWEVFNALINSSGFHLYNAKLEQLVHALHSAWAETLSYDTYLNPLTSGGYIFSEHNRHSDPEGWDTDRAAFGRAVNMANMAWRSLLNYLREKYPMIDLDAASKAAATKYKADQRTPPTTLRSKAK